MAARASSPADLLTRRRWLTSAQLRRALRSRPATVLYVLVAIAYLVSILVLPFSFVASAGLLGAAFVGGLVSVSRRDALTVLTLVVILVYLLPENYVLVGPLRSTGNPALLAGLLALALWAAGRVLGLVEARAAHPVRWLMLAYALASLTAFAAGMTRVLTDTESAGAIRAVFPALAVIGIAMIAVDGLDSRARVELLLRRLVSVALVAAVIGILEFASSTFSYRELMHLPGLTTTTQIINDTRSGFSRIDGAAAHPIEYAVALAALAPLALHFALYDDRRSRRLLAAAALTAILIVNPMTVSRSGLLTLAVGLGVYAVALSRRQRANLVVLGAFGLVLFRSAVPGLLGTLRSLVFIGNTDPSIEGRTEDYAKVPGLLDGHVVFGRGLGTFDPLAYFYLDNQYLGSLLEGGIIGLATLAAVFVIGMGVSRGVRHRATDPALRSLGQALAGSIAALAAAAGTFDELSFKQTGFTLFLLVGAAGALWSQLADRPKLTREQLRASAGPGAGPDAPADAVPADAVPTSSAAPVGAEPVPSAR
ncbi:O-antigen ligase family protein [Phycicoccus sp. HDW14]|uniref:O-antigen ligase family protein n=1 Tax=Phycicoccus sp. HDW14 TaxID=2714941 RepID=UPI001409A879|nr:O-antigen ligase family protein [Phycicoccus sp. HDW14]QIM21698.1 O-antigen ligase family protein [Phycicoccus sp. HDW14]